MTTCTGQTYYLIELSARLSTTLSIMSPQERSRLTVGEHISVEIEKIAHGGHAIARHNGAVIFIRHAIPGEKCTVEITSVGATFNRADVVSVESTSPDRVVAPCKYSHRNGCGGCDFQHISLARQRALKSEVITEQFSRIAKMDINIEVQEVAQPLGWRTRCTMHTSKNGKLGFLKARSHDVVEVEECLVLSSHINLGQLTKQQFPVGSTLEISSSQANERTVVLKNEEGAYTLLEGPESQSVQIAGHSMQVHHQSFWQSHQAAPEILTRTVRDLAGVKSGDAVLDLYGGVGLFTAALCEDVGQQGSITLVEASKSATGDAAKNFANFPHVKIVHSDVAKALPRISRADVIVLDPPREGADKKVIAELIRLQPRCIVYVSCDPASLARDSRALHDAGYPLQDLRAFDLFPMTHHIECVALFTQSKVS